MFEMYLFRGTNSGRHCADLQGLLNVLHTARVCAGRHCCLGLTSNCAFRLPLRLVAFHDSDLERLVFKCNLLQGPMHLNLLWPISVLPQYYIVLSYSGSQLLMDRTKVQPLP